MDRPKADINLMGVSKVVIEKSLSSEGWPVVRMMVNEEYTSSITLFNWGDADIEVTYEDKSNVTGED